MNKLSHSAASRYIKCGESYRLWYVEKYRPKVTSGNLLFGSALDLALNSLLLKDGQDPLKVFLTNWEKGWINKKLVNLSDNVQVVYALSDFDKDILNDSDLLKLSQAMKLYNIDATDPIEAHKQCQNYKKQKDFRQFKEEENKYLNYGYWLSLYRKAELIIDAYRREILPKIKQVKAVQKEIYFENQTGDKITGVVDLIAEWEDGNTYIIDNKSSSRLYEADAVKTSAQLALYANHEGLTKAGFIVYLKNINKDKVRVCEKCKATIESNRVKSCNNEVEGKRCGGGITEVVTPKAHIQVLLDDVNSNMTSMVMSNFEHINQMIKQGVYIKNFDNCDDWYGAPCPFKGVCYNGNYNEIEKD